MFPVRRRQRPGCLLSHAQSRSGRPIATSQSARRGCEPHPQRGLRLRQARLSKEQHHFVHKAGVEKRGVQTWSSFQQNRQDFELAQTLQNGAEVELRMLCTPRGIAARLLVRAAVRAEPLPAHRADGARAAGHWVRWSRRRRSGRRWRFHKARANGHATFRIENNPQQASTTRQVTAV